MKGLIDPDGELFAYLQGNTLYTLDDEPTGRLEGQYILDSAGKQMWRVVGDAVYTLDGQPVGYFGHEKRDDQ